MVRKSLLHAALVLGASMGAYSANSQGMAINSSGAVANTSAMLDVQSTTQGILVPRMTAAQRALISAPAQGLLVYQTDGTSGFYFYNGTAWTSLNGGGGAPTGSAGGDLGGSYPSPTIAATSGAGNDAVAAINAGSATINAANLNLTALNASNLTSGTVPTARLGTGTANSTTFLAGNNTWQSISSGSGTVTSVSASNLSPLFSTSVSNATTTPGLTFTLSNAGAYTVLGNNTGSSAAPTYFIPSLVGAMFSSEGTTTTVLHGNAAGNLSFSAVSLTTDVTGALGATNGGTGNSSYTVGDILYASASGTLSKLSAGSSGKVLTSNGTGIAPSWQTASGGSTGGNFTTVTGSATIASTTQFLQYSSSSAATFTLPVASTYPTNQILYIICSAADEPSITIAVPSGTSQEDFVNGGIITGTTTGDVAELQFVANGSTWYVVTQ